MKSSDFLLQKYHPCVNARRLSHFAAKSVGGLTRGVSRKKSLKVSDSHRNDVSPLTQGLRYRAACDIRRVMADFVPNFVAMATGVGHSRICLALFNSPTPKTPCYTQISCIYLLYKPSYSLICRKFRCHGNRGHLGVISNGAIK